MLHLDSQLETSKFNFLIIDKPCRIFKHKLQLNYIKQLNTHYEIFYHLYVNTWF